MKQLILALSVLFSMNAVGATTESKGPAMTTTTYPTKHISVTINRSVHDVYQFASDPQNLPKWAEGLSRSTLTKLGDEWVADSPMGKVKVKFAAPNNFGVLDHDVTLPSGDVNYNPLRVVRNGRGSEVTFTLFRRPKVTDAEFEKDASAIQKDLTKLKAILEK